MRLVWQPAHTNGVIHASLGRAQRTQGSIAPDESALKGRRMASFQRSWYEHP